MAENQNDLPAAKQSMQIVRSSAIIASYRTPALTESAALSALSAGADEVVVIDNASHDDTVERLKGLQARGIVVLESFQNGGFGAAANIGARAANGATLVFLNSDAAISGTSLGEILSEVRRWNGRGVVGPRLIEPGDSIQRSAGLLPEPSDLIIRMLGLHAIGNWVRRVPSIGALLRHSRLAREYASAETATETIDTNMVSGACFAIGREAFGELGGFDERFFMYFEDADLCRRAAAAGMPIRYVPSAVVTHIGGASSSEDYHFGPLHARSMRQYLGKWYGPGGSVLALLLLWLRAVGMTLSLRAGARRAWRALWSAANDEDPRR